ncbi:MAG TPA: hypothetical protein VEZ70_15255 [Allosphingosinicella sp.]|nr:hypothetical protein [Allosphingosinicella sp.]
MAKSRIAGVLVLAALATPAAAFQGPVNAPVSAEEAVAKQKESLRRTMGLGCNREEGEIVVCAPLGRGDIPFPEEEGKRRRLVAGEVNSAGPISDLGSCCGGSHGAGIDLLAVGSALKKGLEKIF